MYQLEEQAEVRRLNRNENHTVAPRSWKYHLPPRQA